LNRRDYVRFPSKVPCRYGTVCAFLIFCLISFFSVSSTHAQDTYSLPFRNDILEFKAVNDNTVQVSYLVGGVSDAPSPIIDPKFAPSGKFTSIDSSGNDLYIRGPKYTIQIDPKRVWISSSQGGALYFNRDSNAISSNYLRGHIGANSFPNVFYGVENDFPYLARNSDVYEIFGGDQGHAGGMFLWSPTGMALFADVDEGFTSVKDSFEYSKNASTRKNNVFYFIAGTPAEIFHSYYTITGFPDIPPLWALGFIHSKWKQDEQEVLTKINLYHEKDIPLDAFALDFEWMDWGNAWGEFKWNPLNFPSAASGALRDTLAKLNCHLIGMRKPRVHMDEPQGKFADSMGWIFAKGGDYVSGKIVGLIDFYNPAARAWFWNSFIDSSYNSYERGITSYWNDEASYKGSLTHFFMQKAQYDGQRSYNNERVFSLNRNYFCGAQRFGYTLWSGDIQSSFDELAYQRTRMLKSVNLGSGLWSMDIGGFFGRADSTPSTAENFYRWMQMGAFVPIYRVHSIDTAQREPWLYGAEAERISTDFIRLRYELLPYLYSAFHEYHVSGIPPVRPLVFDNPTETGTYDEIRAWKFGSKMIAAPAVTQGENAVTFYLPAGRWYDFWTDESRTGGYDVTVDKGKEKIPLFVRAGAIIPRRKHGKYSLDDAGFSEIDFHIYPRGNDSLAYYEDDFHSYDYEKGKYASIAYVHASGDSIETVRIGKQEGDFSIRPRPGYFIFHTEGRAGLSALLNDLSLPLLSKDDLLAGNANGWARDDSARTIIVKITDPFSEGTVTLMYQSASVRGTQTDPLTLRLEANPAGNELDVIVTSAQNMNAHIEIIDMLGKTDKQFETAIPGGENRLTIPIATLASGSYLLRIRSNEGASTIQFVKNH
jgi:alpha-glucosidase (family GH31 glycosyl hydrolase)